MEDRAEQADSEQEQVRKGDLRLERGIKLFLKAIRPKDEDRVGAWQRDPDEMVLLIDNWEDANGQDRERHVGHWVRDQVSFQVDVELRIVIAESQGRALPSVCTGLLQEEETQGALGLVACW